MTGGLVVSVSGSSFSVKTENGTVNCSCRGKFRRIGLQPLAGDRVVLSPAEEGFVISEIAPRKNSLVRPPAANIDTLLIVVSAAPPQTPEIFIDSLTALAGYKNIRPVICLNKNDLDPGENLKKIYSPIYEVFSVSTVTKSGVPELRNALGDGICLLAGNSGVGKSSLLNALLPGISAGVGELSSRIGRGRQTTRRVELHALPSGGYIADSPGYSAFDAVEMELGDLDLLPETFPEFKNFLDKCRWGNCGHAGDDGCAVTEAAENGLISPSRRESYLQLRKTMLQAEKQRYR